ncbi:hypothetical protein EV126DRAFT_94593 [Verticillium dahliae]|nr:hypothetical protein EV126DRAFT_94593 [Verticillium dahliae]
MPELPLEFVHGARVMPPRQLSSIVVVPLVLLLWCGRRTGVDWSLVVRRRAGEALVRCCGHTMRGFGASTVTPGQCSMPAADCEAMGARHMAWRRSNRDNGRRG